MSRNIDLKVEKQPIQCYNVALYESKTSKTEEKYI